ncbi:MAG: hypothetical protein EOO96_07200 [Pedobacter sp.]|nr:MAG: hypothetical protein EOO96_07200 [Pedobacter sp.]
MEILEIVKAFTPAFLGIVGIVITVIYSAANKKLNHQKMEKDLFKEFNERYNDLNEDLKKINKNTSTEQLQTLKSEKDDKKTLELVVIDYFNLCAEEYYWKKRKRISEEIWNAWHDGMMYYYNFPAVKNLWKTECESGWRSYYLDEKEDFFNLG